MWGREFAETAGPLDARIDASPGDVRELIEKEIFAVPAFSSQGGPFRRRAGRMRPFLASAASGLRAPAVTGPESL